MIDDAELIGFKFLVLPTTFNGSENLTFVKIDIYHSSMTERLSLVKMEEFSNFHSEGMMSKSGNFVMASNSV